jgi:sodium-dependent dicarboxylate transporter 2/3/5
MIRRAVVGLGPVAFLLTVLLPAPGALSEQAWHVAGLAAWMAAWWLTAAVPLEATALLPIVFLPLVGVAPLARVTRSYADPIIFLFLGGFLLAATLERWNLHKRFALSTVRAVGTDARRVLLAFMLASAVASMWISNTATAIMMLPIAAAVLGGRPGRGGGIAAAPGGLGELPAALMLGVAYAASIGGVATLIGTPPNAIFAGAARELLGEDVSFAQWMALGVPISIVMLAGCWLVLVALFRVRGKVPGLADTLEREHRDLGPLTGGERFVLTVFGLTALAWVLRAPKEIGSLRIPGLSDLLPGISDPAIAIAAALVLFVTPLKGQRHRVALDWESASKVPWGILLLFGGGLALAGAFEASGLSQWLGGRLASLRGVPLPFVMLVTAAVFVFLTELTSNTATSALGMPLIAGVAIGLGLPALPLMATVAVASSMAFMLPVATPPNAIVFGSGWIRPAQMARAGILLNLMSILITTVALSIRAALTG